jgi:membrane protein
MTDQKQGKEEHMTKAGPASRISYFMRHGIWEVRLNKIGPAKAIPIRCLRVVLLAVRGFMEDNCQKTASVLTYYSILNAVPLIAVAFAIAKGFGLEKLVRQQIIEMADNAQWQSEITQQILNFSGSLLEQAKGGLIAGLGIVLLFYTVITILGKIEEFFNDIWDVRKSRSLVRKFSDYLAILVLAPVLLVVSSSVTVVAASKLGEIIKSYSALGHIGPLISFLMSFIPYVSIWALLTALYLVMPNTRIPVRSAVIGGIAAGTLYQLVQWIYIKFQIGVSSYGAIYGSFAALPLFLGWLQTSWIIILFGAELAHADRHYETFGFQPDYSRIGGAARKLLALRIYHLLVRRFSKAEPPNTIDEIAYALEIPIRLTGDILSDLMAAGLVVEVVRANLNDIAFQPGRSVQGITIRDVIEAYEQTGQAVLPTARSEEENQISAYLKSISETIERSSGNVKIVDI